MKSIERFLVLRTIWIRLALSVLFLYETVFLAQYFGYFLDQLRLGIKNRNVVGEFSSLYENRLDIGLGIAILVGISVLMLGSLFSAVTIFRRPKPYICMVASLLPCSFLSGWERCYINIIGFLMLFAVLSPPIYQQKSPSPSGNGLSDS